jgi:preprotein translocase subunit SecF
MTDVLVPDTIDQRIADGQRRGPFGRLYQGETSIDFWGRRWWGLIASGILVLVTIGSLVFNGLNLGLDFEGGVAWEVPTGQITEAQVRQVLADNNVDASNSKVQTLTPASGQSRLRIQVGDYPPDVVQKVQAELATKAGVGVEEVSSTSVSSSWGRSITEKAVRALIIFLILVALFITWRFEWRMALAAIVAMLHDVLISVGVYSLLRFEVTPATVVAFLTILGFSLYDTIVVFDKVKENTQRYSGTRASVGDTLNVSMNQVLMRSLNTSIAAVMPVLSLLVVGSVIMGAVALREFALALLVGLITGSYSSIYIAAPLLGIFKEREPRYRSTRGQHVTGVDLERLVLGASPDGARRDGLRARRAAAAVAGGDGEATVSVPVRPAPTSGLTHPPRPRKKKRR